jgi:hypothetical protein
MGSVVRLLAARAHLARRLCALWAPCLRDHVHARCRGRSVRWWLLVLTFLDACWQDGRPGEDTARASSREHEHLPLPDLLARGRCRGVAGCIYPGQLAGSTGSACAGVLAGYRDACRKRGRSRSDLRGGVRGEKAMLAGKGGRACDVLRRARVLSRGAGGPTVRNFAGTRPPMRLGHAGCSDQGAI